MRILWMLALTLAFCSPTAFAIDRVTVDLPFTFESHGKIFPASKYDVELSANHNFLTMASRTDPAIRYSWLVTPADSGTHDPALSIHFDCIGNTAELHAVRLGSYSTPVLDEHTTVSLKSQIAVRARR